MKTLPYGAKLEAIKKAMKTGQKFYLQTYLGTKEVTGIDMNGTWATTGNLNNNTLRSWAICSTHVDCWYEQLGEIEPETEADINKFPGVNINLKDTGFTDMDDLIEKHQEKKAEPVMSIDKLTEDEKHNWGDLILEEQRQVMDPMVPFNTKANILTCDGDEYACYLCKRAFNSEAHLRQHIKAHLRKMGATGDAYDLPARKPRRLTRQKMIAKVKSWITQVEKAHGENFSELYRFENVEPGEREDDAKAFRFYFDGQLYEVINYYRQDGMYKSMGSAFEELTKGTGWFMEAESASVEYFVEWD